MLASVTCYSGLHVGAKRPVFHLSLRDGHVIFVSRLLSREPCKYTFSKGEPSKFLNSFGRGFVMASLNINSLLAHIDDLKIFVTDSKIDILAINEIKLDRSVGDSEIRSR